MAKVLLVDDDKDLLRTSKDFLTFEQHTVDTASCVQDAYGLLAAAEYDLVVLDWEMPDGTGLDVLQRLRSKGYEGLVLMLTGRASVEDRSEGLDSGADDYLVKPFSYKEFGSRVRALLRRTGAGLQVSNVLHAGELSLDPKTLQVTKGAAEVKLARAEFALLEFLMRHPNEVFSAEALISRVWPTDAAVSSESVRTCVKRLRQKIGEYGDGKPIIETLHSIGYRLNTQK